MCEYGGACTYGHVGGVAGGAQSGALVNIASFCCVCNNAAQRSRVYTVNADTLSLVACADVLLASRTCCRCAIKPSFMDSQLSSSNTSVFFATWYPIVPSLATSCTGISKVSWEVFLSIPEKSPSAYTTIIFGSPNGTKEFPKAYCAAWYGVIYFSPVSAPRPNIVIQSSNVRIL